LAVIPLGVIEPLAPALAVMLKELVTHLLVPEFQVVFAAQVVLTVAWASN
jgi:hypothetical protein